MMHHKDQNTSIPKAFIFRKGQATLWAAPVNDNRCGNSKWWHHRGIWVLLGTAMAYMFYALS